VSKGTHRATARIVLTAAAAAAARRGHPWIWANGVTRGLGEVAPGDEVELLDGGGAYVGRGIADPRSPIAVRVWTTTRARVDGALVGQRLRRADAIRACLFEDGSTTAYRLVNGEGDRMPGFVVDRYAHVAVLRTDGEGAAARAPAFADTLWPLLEARGVRTLVHRASKRERARPAADDRGARPSSAAVHALLRGESPPDTIDVREHGVPFVVDLAHGQKTGAFLDQRENRRRVGAMARGRRVLNLFSYAGGFSLRAALGRAAHVTSVDIASDAHATAQTSFTRAGVDPRAHAFVTADAFAFLDRARSSGQKWELVVSDPPSFAPSEKALPRALQAYRKLHRACAEVLAPGGILCASSCSSHVDAEAFASTLDDAALARDDLRVLEMHGQPADHPTTPAWPEGRYLKFVVLG
jgi:23S rRNA (cytosine1962-C5)-methyltransferase